MGGFRTKEFYINKYGEEKGNEEYSKLEKARFKRLSRKKNNIKITLTGDDDHDISSGTAIRCKECGFVTTRLQWTHFANKCTGDIRTIQDYRDRHPDELVVAPALAAMAAVTERSLTKLYGNEEGAKRWQAYCDKQAETNTLEYKKAKYGMNEKEFKAYNKSRSVTLENLIKRHGEEDGLIKWDEYCERQRYTTSLDYFVEKYGKEKGQSKYTNFTKKRVRTSISKTEKYIGSILDDSFTIQYMIDGWKKPFDFGSEVKKIVMEYNGSLWHADPRKYHPEWINPVNKKSSIDIWDKDARKRQSAIDAGYRVYTIWEMDFNNDIEKTISDMIEWINGTEQTGSSRNDNKN